MNDVQQHHQGERKAAGAGQRHDGDHRDEHPVPALDQQVERDDEQQDMHRLRVRHLQDRRQRRNTEQHDGEQCCAPRYHKVHEPVEHQRRCQRERHGHEDGDDGEALAGQFHEHANDRRICRHERPGVLGNMAAGRHRQGCRVAHGTDDVIPVTIPDGREVDVARMRHRPLVGPLPGCEGQHDGGRDHARGDKDDENLHPPRGEPVAHPEAYGAVSHARSPRSHSSISLAATRSSSAWAFNGSPGP